MLLITKRSLKFAMKASFPDWTRISADVARSFRDLTTGLGRDAVKIKGISYLQDTSDSNCRGRAILRRAGVAIPFNVERDDAVNSLLEHVEREANIPAESRYDKEAHEIVIIPALSKFGKTRTLYEFTERLPSLSTSGKVFKSLYITHNQGSEEADWERASDTESLLAWRMLYFYFGPKHILWRDFASTLKVQGDVVAPLTLQEAFALITTDIRELSPSSAALPLVLVLCIDEYQRISDYDASYRRLKELIGALAARMVAPGNDIIVLVFAGLLRSVADIFMYSALYVLVANLHDCCILFYLEHLSGRLLWLHVSDLTISN